MSRTVIEQGGFLTRLFMARHLVARHLVAGTETGPTGCALYNTIIEQDGEQTYMKFK